MIGLIWASQSTPKYTLRNSTRSGRCYIDGMSDTEVSYQRAEAVAHVTKAIHAIDEAASKLSRYSHGSPSVSRRLRTAMATIRDADGGVGGRDVRVSEAAQTLARIEEDLRTTSAALEHWVVDYAVEFEIKEEDVPSV